MQKQVVDIDDNTNSLYIYIIGKHDPLLRLINYLAGNKKIRVWLIAITIYLFTIFLPGTLISMNYRGVDPIIPIYDSRDFPFAFFGYIILAPVVWIFYSWQVRGFVKMLFVLERNEVINLGKYKLIKHKEELKSKFDNIAYSLILLFITIAAGIIWVWSLGLPNPFNIGGTNWIYINNIYLIYIMVPVDMLGVYMVLNILLRQTIITSILYKLVNNSPVLLRPFHSDKCNGFSSVGIYILQISTLGILLGFWVSAIFMFPALYGQPINIKIDTILQFIVYIVLVPFTVIYSAWGTHLAMSRAKDSALDLIANQIQKIILQTDLKEIQANKEMLQELDKRYNLLLRELKTWPFPSLALNNFIFSAIVPLAPALLSYFFNKYFHAP